jgi:murein DD-endopeptidase MepM/ murein hydrolase activator NlpD
MPQAILIFTLTFFVLSSSLAQDIGQPFAQGGGEYLVPKSECVHSQQRREITDRLQANTDYLKREGILTSPGTGSERVVTFFEWPLQQASGFNFNSYYGISNYIDQNENFPDQIQDYNCGNRSYDLNSGYNHPGTDIFLWPFPWDMVNNNQIEVIAAAAGVLIGKDDGNIDTNCDFSNSNWNAVYIQHNDGSVAWYGHMKNGSLTNKTVGQFVTQGEYLGVVASSGSSTNPHLHFEVWADNSYTTLVDPWEGPCNTITGSSWWLNQKPYREPTINHAITGTAPVELMDCPNPDITYEAGTFLPGSTIYFTIFFHDQLAGQVTNRRLYQPDGSLWTSLANLSSPETYNASYWWIAWTFPGTEPLGTWTFEVTHDGEVKSYPFEIASDIVSVNEAPQQDRNLIAYPNPAREGYVFLSSGSDLELNKLTVYDQLGRIVLQNNALTEKTQEVDVSALANGFYIFVVSTESGMLYGRVFIE